MILKKGFSSRAQGAGGLRGHQDHRESRESRESIELKDQLGHRDHRESMELKDQVRFAVERIPFSCDPITISLQC